MSLSRPVFIVLATFLMLVFAVPLQAQDTTISYQGQLRDGGQPYTGTADLEFRLFDQLSGGSQVGTAQQRPNWPIEDGLFQVGRSKTACFRSSWISV